MNKLQTLNQMKFKKLSYAAVSSRLFRRISRDRLQSTKRKLSEYIKKNRHKRTPILIDKLTQKLRGHYNYFGAVGNLDDLFSVYFHAVGKLYKWLNRRSGRKSMTWARLKGVCVS
jgi:RNA-directed DNA polymerase